MVISIRFRMLAVSNENAHSSFGHEFDSRDSGNSLLIQGSISSGNDVFFFLFLLSIVGSYNFNDKPPEIQPKRFSHVKQNALSLGATRSHWINSSPKMSVGISTATYCVNQSNVYRKCWPTSSKSTPASSKASTRRVTAHLSTKRYEGSLKRFCAFVSLANMDSRSMY